MRTLAVLLALPAACHNQPETAVNAVPPVNEVQAPPPRNDLQVAEDIVRRRLGHGQPLSFANGRLYRSQGVPIVCGEVARGDRRGRYVAIDGRDAWLELEGDLPPAQMDAVVREFCTGARRPS